MKKFFKIMMIVIMLLGIGFSLLNFASFEVEAVKSRALYGAYVYQSGSIRCMGDGTDCIIRP